MSDRLDEATDLPLHPAAAERAREYVDRFATDLLLQSKVLAYRQRADEVLTPHVDEAFEVVNRTRTEGWGSQVLIIVGGALFGAFIPGFVTELSATKPNVVLIVIYTALGFFGLFATFMGLRR